MWRKSNDIYFRIEMHCKSFAQEDILDKIYEGNSEFHYYTCGSENSKRYQKVYYEEVAVWLALVEKHWIKRVGHWWID